MNDVCSSTRLTGPAFSPWGRYKLLALALDGVPRGCREQASFVMGVRVATAIVVVRHVKGDVSHAAAYAAIERARLLTEPARLGAHHHQQEGTTTA